MTKSVLIISQSPPWAGVQAREALDVVLAAGAFGLPTTLLLLDDGVLQVAAQQQPQVIGQKNIQQQMQALPLFDVSHIYVCQESVKQKKIMLNQSLNTLPVTAKEICELIRQFDVVIDI